MAKVRAAGASKRKPVLICYGAVKDRQPFGPGWASEKAP
jgi:hypothetical protein